MNQKDPNHLSEAKVIPEESFIKTEVQALADNTEIAIGTVYMYFENKDDILEYFLRHNMFGP